MKKHSAIIVSFILFILSFNFGLSLAKSKPLWGDEIYSQLHSIAKLSYGDIFLGRIPEGNVCPLFYTLQKVICDLTGYHLPELAGQSGVDFIDPFTQMILRISPLLAMALAVFAIFYYFARFYSWFSAFYSLLISGSSYMIWAYWAEARHYALWVFLTTIQSLLFLYLIQEKKTKTRVWIALVVVHFLLSLTVIFSLAQIMIVSLLLWIFLERNWKRYILLTAIPVFIALTYYVLSPKYAFQFGLTPEQMIRDCIARDYFYIIFIYTLFSVLYFFQRKFGQPKLFANDLLMKPLPYVILTFLALGFVILLMVIFKMKAVPGQGFHIASRYFIFLTPIGIIATVLSSIYVVKALAGRWYLQGPVMAGIGYFAIHRFIKMVPHIKNICSTMFS